MRENKKRKMIALVSSAATFLVLCGLGVWSYLIPYTYVTLDVNPSIEYSVNRFDRVLSAKAVNEDGDKIIKEIGLSNLKNKSIEYAVEETIDQISSEGYFDSDVEGGLVISTYGDDTQEAEELADDLENLADEVNEDNGDIVEVESFSPGLELVTRARELGVTPGKLNIVEKYAQSTVDPESVNIEEWINKPVKDIMKATIENKKLQKKPIDSETEMDTEQSTEQNTEQNTEQSTEQNIIKSTEQETNSESNNIKNKEKASIKSNSNSKKSNN